MHVFTLNPPLPDLQIGVLRAATMTTSSSLSSNTQRDRDNAATVRTDVVRLADEYSRLHAAVARRIL